MSRPARRPLTSRFSSWMASWLAVCALLLKAAVPLLASVSAEAQGKALVEVCTIHGVQTVVLKAGEGEAPVPDPAYAAAVEPCVLAAALSLGATPMPSATPTLFSARASVHPIGPPPAHAFDASARWQARLGHGPPARG